MRRFHEQLSGRRDQVALALAVVFSTVLLLGNDRPQVWALRAGLVELYGAFRLTTSWVEELRQVRAKNQELRRLNTSLLLENSRLREAYLENQRLRALLGFKSRSRTELIPARVLGHQANGFIHAILLDAGQADGIRKNMPLVTADGLVGQVYEVTDGYALGQLLIDRNFKVSVRVQRSRVTGIVGWAGGNRCVLREVPLRSDVRPGDVVVTSGYSAIYPPGIRVGVVSKVHSPETGLFMDVEVFPQVDFGTLEEVCALRTAAGEL